jgi:hypothetical protein
LHRVDGHPDATKENVSVYSYGNVLAAIPFLEGLVVEDLKKKELDVRDPNDELIIGVRAVKPVLT